MRNPVMASVVLGATVFGFAPDRAVAQPSILAPMNVETYRVMLRVSRNAGWASTAYRNYLIGLFEGLLHAQSNATSDRQDRLFCLPADKSRGTMVHTFEWMEKELNTVVAKAEPTAMVARIFVSHLSTSYPCQG